MGKIVAPVIAVSSPSFAKSSELIAEVKDLGLPVVVTPKPTELTEEELGAFLRQSGATVAIVGRERLTAAVLELAKDLRFVAKYGVGLDNLDPRELGSRGVGLGWTPGVNRRAVAELVLSFALGHRRNVWLSIDRCRQGLWVKDGGLDLSGATIGIVGFGAVGSEVATLLTPFGCRILYRDIVDRSQTARGLGAEAVSLERLLRESDVVTLHVPLTKETQSLIDTAAIGLLKSTALLINTARGGVVDFAAACEAVREGRLGGFAADVFPEEPCDLSSWAHPHLYFTPHIGGNSRQAVLAMGRSAIDHVRRHLGLTRS